MSVFEKIFEKKKLAVLIDPDKAENKFLKKIVSYADKNYIDLILVGGSLIQNQIDRTINFLKTHTNIPIVIFPGSVFQVSNQADAILLLSLISGRNADYLIGNHVIAAQFLKKSKLEIIPTGYILLEGGKTSSVEYISNTKPIPVDKIEIIVSTALAGEMLGMKSIYLEAGSGANICINQDIIKEVAKNISIPVIVGGGIDCTDKLEKILKAGANIAVVGTVVEKTPEIIPEFHKVIQKLKK